jgi:putative ABC transport system permease protein
MLKNYLKVSFRNVLKQKAYSIITILGLSIGITCCLLIVLYVKQELSFDKFHSNADRIYRIAIETIRPEGTSYMALNPIPLAPVLKTEYPEIKKFTRIFFDDGNIVQFEDKKFVEDGLIFADPGFFEIFSFPFIKGSTSALLEDPSSVVITSSMAEKYFGNEEPIGKVIRYRNKYNFKITGVIDDVPVNSHFHFKFVFSFEALNEDIVGWNLDEWGAFPPLYTYVLFEKDINIEEFDRKTESFIMRHHKQRGLTRKIFFQSLTDIHLRSHIESEIEPNNYASNLIILLIIGFFILGIACINYVNLATAYSSKRAKEVGIRKVLGAGRMQLVKQFMGESILFSIFSLFLSFVFVEFFLSPFSSLVGKPIEFVYKDNMLFLTAVFFLALIVGIISGIYPALFLSRYKPIRVLKGKENIGRSSFGQLFSREVLVVMQFIISIALIIGTLIVAQQLHFLRDTHLGFDKENTIVLPLFDESVRSKYETLKNEYMTHPHVLGVTACFKTPISDNSFVVNVLSSDGLKGRTNFLINMNFVDFDYIDNFGIEMSSGRKFSKEFSTHFRKTFIVNEAARKKLGFSSPEDALGKKFMIGVDRLEGAIIGVAKDYHIASLHEKIEPVALFYYPPLFSELAVRIQPHNRPETIKFLEKTWNELVPDYPFQFSFLDEEINRLYIGEEQTSKIIRTFSIIAIAIACLGLFGLAAYNTERRTKEIGIRKVLGATVSGIVYLLTKEFTVLVLIANIIAWPVAYYAMSRWLQGFAYRINIELLTFIVAATLALIIALITVSYHAFKAAYANPVEALRYE